MNFDWNNEQLTFRQAVRDFLAAHLPKDWESLAHGPGSESQAAFAKKFCAQLAQAGLLVPHWPQRWGGRDADPWTAFILAEEMWAAGEPRGGQYMNVNWIGPTLMRYGSQDQQARYIPPMARGETIWCQGFSEPEAGSDLASLRTRAERTDRAIASAVRRSGPRMQGTPTRASCWLERLPDAMASPFSCFPCRRPASSCGRFPV